MKSSDATTEKKYFTQICNLIDELDLSPLAIALYLHFKRTSFNGEFEKNGVKFLKEKYKVGSDKIRAAKDELVKNKLIKFNTFDPKLAKPDEAVLVDVWERNHKYFESLNTEPIPIQERVSEPIPIQEQTHTHIGIDPYPYRNALNKEEYIKDIKERENNAETAPTLETETEAENRNTGQPSPYPLLNSDEAKSLPPPPRRMSSDEAAAALDAEQRFTDLPASEAEKIWRGIFGAIYLKGEQIKTLSEIENLNGQVFLETCRLWKQDGYRPQSIGSLIDKYRNALKFSTVPKTQTGILQHSTKPTSKFYH